MGDILRTILLRSLCMTSNQTLLAPPGGMVAQISRAYLSNWINFFSSPLWQAA